MLQAEVSKGIEELSSRSLFNLVAYNIDYQIYYPGRCPRATAGNKAAAVTWVNGLSPIESHCCEEGMLAALELGNRAPVAKRGRKEARTFIFMGNRTPFCGNAVVTDYGEQVLASVTAANRKRAPIHTVFAPEWQSEVPTHRLFWEQLAQMNRGTFTQVNDFSNDQP